MMLDVLLLANSCLAGIGGFLSSPLTSWTAVAVIGIIAVFAVISFAYILAPLIGRTELQTWLRLKMYESLTGLFLVLIVGSLATAVCTINPAPAAKGVGLLPSTCDASQSAQGSSDISNLQAMIPKGGINDVYALSECDLYAFNQMVISTNNQVLGELNLLIAASPTTKVEFAPLLKEGIPGVGGSLALSPGSPTIQSFFSNAISTVQTIFILSQVQLLILDSSMLIFAIFMVMGIIARIFGVTRSFGGTLIAFAMGIGLVFPILIAVTYGFMDSTLIVLQNNANFANIPSTFLQALASAISNPNPSVAGFLGNVLSPVIALYGITAVGLLIIPFINFTVLDTFIIDLSKVIGEQVDFMSLLTSV